MSWGNVDINAEGESLFCKSPGCNIKKPGQAQISGLKTNVNNVLVKEWPVVKSGQSNQV